MRLSINLIVIQILVLLLHLVSFDVVRLTDVLVNVKVGKQTQHDHHVISEQIKTPSWEMTPSIERKVQCANCVTKRHHKLYL